MTTKHFAYELGVIESEHNAFVCSDSKDLANLTDALNDLVDALELALDLADNDLVDFDKYGLACDADITEVYRAAITKARGGIGNE